ncbi:MAG TPA: hypothetical protein VNX68_12900 [Nitrosopumilaceae archaeon]|jgi:hypothetical protein|nr:hypothetical protein [Nitrosopumilaceae archaeon]
MNRPINEDVFNFDDQSDDYDDEHEWFNLFGEEDVEISEEDED